MVDWEASAGEIKESLAAFNGENRFPSGLTQTQETFLFLPVPSLLAFQPGGSLWQIALHISSVRDGSDGGGQRVGPGLGGYLPIKVGWAGAGLKEPPRKSTSTGVDSYT